MHPSLVKNILQGVMLMEPSYANAYKPFIHGWLTGNEFPIAMDQVVNHVPEFFYAQSPNRNSSAGENNSSGEKRVAVLPVKGAIIKYDEPCGNRGTETLANWIKSCDQNRGIDAIVLDFDSGGGMGSATNSPSSAIANCSKPILAYSGNGMTASAAYWIAAHCDEIYATYKSDEIGSIGTYVTLANFIKYYKEKHGLEIKELYASKSKKKNKLFRDALESEEGEKALIEEYIDPFNEDFINTVKKERPGISEDVFEGALYRADEAKKLNLIDGFKTFEETLQRAAELAA